ncbi:MAG TPA: carbohydrate-binding family 9-like protein [Armatimonadota bacterium]|nr:carbohydrate-binding family 9-like protein [Armatimonadota bacterium]
MGGITAATASAIGGMALLLPAARGPEYVPPRGYVCYRAPGPVDIDGRLGKAVWAAAPWTEDFGDIEGDVKPPPPLRTRAKMLWDDEFFYVGAELEEPHVWATLTEHDSVIFHDNDFEIFIDPDGDSHEYYEIELNALGTEWDLRLPKPYRDGGSAVNEWEIPGLRLAVHVEGTLNDPSDIDRFWSVEIAFPWSALGGFAGVPCPPRHGDQWRINFSRVEWQTTVQDGRYVKVPGRPEDNWVWSPQHVVDMHRPETWGYVQFSTAEPGRDAFVPDPSGPGRWVLHRIYYAQQDFREANGVWARTLGDLGLEGLTHDSIAEGPELRQTAAGWEADVRIGAEVGAAVWRIREDSRIWRPKV